MTDVPAISTASLARRLEAGERLLLLDTRSPSAHASFPFDAHAARIVNLPYEDVRRDPAAALAVLPAPADAGVVVAFCSRGSASRAVVSVLRSGGYNAESLEGGILSWSERVEATQVPGSETLGREAAVVQFRRVGKGCLGYAIIGQGTALVVDVGRNVEPVLAEVSRRGARITHALDTHLHADHVSGGPALAVATGARYGLPRADAGGFDGPFDPVFDGSTWHVGGIEVRAIATPGHTDGSTSYAIGGRYLLTGDTLFVNGVGRPDLSGEGERLARLLHASLLSTIARLPDDWLVLPAHAAGRSEVAANGIVGVMLGDLRQRTLDALPHDPAVFARTLLDALPEQPPNYEQIRVVNRGAPANDPSELEFGPNRCAIAGAR